MDKAKNSIIVSIRENTQQLAYPYPDYPDFPKNGRALPEEFKEKLVLGGGAWFEVKDGAEAQQLIRKLRPEAKIVCSATPEVKGNKDIGQVTDPRQLDDVDVGVMRARFGVSENGMVWLTEKDLKVNALGFLSQHVFILLDPEQLVRDMYEAYARIELEQDNYGCFMLGPSATADIGAYMVRGAQGARTLTVLFMEMSGK